MNVIIGLLAVILQITGVVSVANPVANPVDAALAEEYSNLGVMVVPEGVNASEYRKCVDHPLGESPRKYWQSLAPVDEEYVKRDALASPVNLKSSNIFDRAVQVCYY